MNRKCSSLSWLLHKHKSLQTKQGFCKLHTFSHDLFDIGFECTFPYPIWNVEMNIHFWKTNALIGQLSFAGTKSALRFNMRWPFISCTGPPYINVKFYVNRRNTLNFSRENLDLKYFQEISIRKLNFESEAVVSIYIHTGLIWSRFHIQKWAIDMSNFDRWTNLKGGVHQGNFSTWPSMHQNMYI